MDTVSIVSLILHGAAVALFVARRQGGGLVGQGVPTALALGSCVYLHWWVAVGALGAFAAVQAVAFTLFLRRFGADWHENA